MKTDRRGCSMIHHRNIQPKSRTLNGHRWQPRELNEYHADIAPGRSIRIHGQRFEYWGRLDFDSTFLIGDLVSRGMPVLTNNRFGQHQGRIVTIGRKTITVQIDGRRVRLDLWQFASKNCGDLGNVRLTAKQEAGTLMPGLQ